MAVTVTTLVLVAGLEMLLVTNGVSLFCWSSGGVSDAELQLWIEAPISAKKQYINIMKCIQTIQ